MADFTHKPLIFVDKHIRLNSCILHRILDRKIMKRIVLFGAGKSAYVLIKYLADYAQAKGWQLVICDKEIENVRIKFPLCNAIKLVELDVQNEPQRREHIETADIVISMLPSHLHFLIALDCKDLCKHLLTASYIDDKILPFAKEIEDKNLIFLYEMGLDPGIDHMSAMAIIHKIKNSGGTITSFSSHCGGLVAPESDNNPWHYKISWNPRNVVLAGKDGAVYKEKNRFVTVPYSMVFRNGKEVFIEGIGKLGWYPNRDSSNYIKNYKLEEASTFLRTTLRFPSFNRGWSKLINIGLTSIDDFQLIKDCKTYADWFKVKTKPYTENEVKWNSYLHMYITDPFKSEFDRQIAFLGLQRGELIEEPFNCSADILQHLMERKMALAENDHDMIVMLHEIEYNISGQRFKLSSNLVYKGKDSKETAMATTVGLPLGIAAKMILEGKIVEKGLKIPTAEEIYRPVMDALQEFGIVFTEKTEEIN